MNYVQQQSTVNGQVQTSLTPLSSYQMIVSYAWTPLLQVGLQYIYDTMVENRPPEIISGELVQVFVGSLASDFVTKTFLDFSTLASNSLQQSTNIIQAGIFTVLNYYSLMLMKSQGLFLDDKQYRGGRNTEQFMAFQLGTSFLLKLYEEKLISWILGVTIVPN